MILMIPEPDAQTWVFPDWVRVATKCDIEGHKFPHSGGVYDPATGRYRWLCTRCSKIFEQDQMERMRAFR